MIKFCKIHGKTCVGVSIFKKVGVLRPATLLKKETLPQVFYCEFSKKFKKTFFTEHLCTTVSDHEIVVIDFE